MIYLRHSTIQILILVVLSLVTLACGNPAKAEISIEQPWVRLVPPVNKMTAGYLSITNSGNEEDKLISCSSTSAEVIEIHETIAKGGGMGMVERTSITIPAKGKATFAPGGIHLMIMGLNQPTKPGQTFPLELTFEKAGTIKIDAPIQSE